MDKYEDLIIEVVFFETNDVITASDPIDNWGEEG